MSGRLLRYYGVITVVILWSILSAGTVFASGGPGHNKLFVAQATYNCGGTCVGKDPYTYYAGNQRCLDGAYIANSAPIPVPSGFSAELENWYSPKCVTNWAFISWTNGKSSQTQVEIQEVNPPYACQWYPENTNCNVNTSFYAGGLSPSWTNMIDGTHLTRADGTILYQGLYYSTGDLEA